MEVKINNSKRTFNGVRVYVLPPFITHMPYCKEISGCYFGGHFYLRKPLYENLFSNNPGAEAIGLCIHETEHIRRSEKSGRIRYMLKYQLSRRFRYAEELACHRPQFRYFREVKYNFDID